MKGPDARSIRRERTVELVVFLLLVVPPEVISLFAGQEGQSVGFDVMAWAVIAKDVALASLLFFLLWRNGEAPEAIGVSWGRGWREVALGFVLLPPLSLLGGLLETGLQRVGLSAPSGPLPAFFTARGGEEVALAFLLVTVAAVTEEIVFRGYLITRFRFLTGSTFGALVLSSALFSLGHHYEGSAGMITVGVMGLSFGLIFLWRGDLVAATTLHFLQDLTNLLIVPLIVSRLS